jgi:predicted ATP-dependent endonuclease of OLD family
MKLSKLRIENFRSFKDETIYFDDYTCLVGTNGTGKSAVLTALNVFFRNNASTATNVLTLSDEDFHYKRTGKPVKITLTFVDLSEEAKNDFKHYFRQEELTIFAKAVWDNENESAEVMQYGARRVIKKFAPFFEAEDNKAKVVELKEIYDNLKLVYPDLPAPGAKQAMIDALRSYEENNPDDCELLDDSAQFYGWTKGSNLLKKYIQWIYIPAVKDASSEQEEGSKTALGQLLERTIRTKVNFEEPIDDLRKQLEKGYKEIVEKQQDVLSNLQNSIQNRLRNWTNPSATVELNWHYDPNKSLVINEPIARAAIGEDNFIGEIARLGHGMQRAFIVSILQELAVGDQGESPKLILGFEEPELYQHPPQAQHMASLLEELATGPEKNTQIILCTHSPYFISSKGFENIRVLRKNMDTKSSVVYSATYKQIEERLADAMGESLSSPTSLMARIAQIMQPSQNELYFTRIAILVEGIEDIAFISAHLQLSGKWPQFREFGCHFVVGDGKTSLSRALAICKELYIPAFVVFDSDANQKKENDIKNNRRDNSCILRLCDLKDFDPLPSDNLWHSQGVMWKTKIADVVMEGFGKDVWEKAENNARKKMGFTENVKRKNRLLIAATLEELSSEEKQSAILEILCDKLLGFAKKP